MNVKTFNDSIQKNDPSAIDVDQTKDNSEAQAFARIVLSPSLQSALTCKSASKTDPPVY